MHHAPDSELSTVLAKVIETSLDPERWNDVCDLLSERHGGAFLIYTFDVTGEGSGSVWMPSDWRARADDLMEEYISRQPIEEMEANKRLARKPAHVWITELEFFDARSDSEIPRMDFRERLQARFGLKSRCGARINDIGPWLDVACMHMPGLNRDYPQEVKHELSWLSPVFGKAVETSRIISTLTGRYSALLEVFDTLSFGAAFIDKRHKVLLANAFFDRMARDRDALTVGADRRPAPMVGDSNVISALVARVADATAGHRNSLITLPRRSGRRPIVVYAARVLVPDLAGDELTLLMFVDPHEEQDLSAQGLRAFGVLSEAELNVCELLVAGLGTNEIAEHRDTSIETTRTQIKSAATKLACPTRLELLRLALATRPPLGTAANDG